MNKYDRLSRTQKEVLITMYLDWIQHCTEIIEEIESTLTAQPKSQNKKEEK